MLPVPVQVRFALTLCYMPIKVVIDLVLSVNQSGFRSSVVTINDMWLICISVASCLQKAVTHNWVLVLMHVINA